MQVCVCVCVQQNNNRARIINHQLILFFYHHDTQFITYATIHGHIITEDDTCTHTRIKMLLVTNIYRNFKFFALVHTLY